MEMSVYLHALEALFSGKSLQFPVTSKLIGPVRQPGCFVEAINHVPLPGFEPCNSQTIGNKMKCMVVCLCNQCFGSFSKCLSVVNNTPQYLSRQIEWLVTNRLMRNWDLRSLTTGLDMEDLVIIMYFFFTVPWIYVRSCSHHILLNVICAQTYFQSNHFSPQSAGIVQVTHLLNCIAQFVFHLLIQQTPFSVLLSIYSALGNSLDIPIMYTLKEPVLQVGQ